MKSLSFSQLNLRLALKSSSQLNQNILRFWLALKSLFLSSSQSCLPLSSFCFKLSLILNGGGGGNDCPSKVFATQWGFTVIISECLGALYTHCSTKRRESRVHVVL
jgi:hypothetical protein